MFADHIGFSGLSEVFATLGVARYHYQSDHMQSLTSSPLCLRPGNLRCWLLSGDDDPLSQSLEANTVREACQAIYYPHPTYAGKRLKH